MPILSFAIKLCIQISKVIRVLCKKTIKQVPQAFYTFSKAVPLVFYIFFKSMVQKQGT